MRFMMRIDFPAEVFAREEASREPARRDALPRKTAKR